MFPEDKFNIGTAIQLKSGLRHRVVTVTANHLRRMVLSSLRGIRHSSGAAASESPISTQDARPHSLTVCIPEDVIFACAHSVHANIPHALPDFTESLPAPTPLVPLSTSNSSGSAPNQVGLELLQQAFATFPIKSSQVAVLIGVYISSNPADASMRSVSNAFVELIKNAEEENNDTSKLRWWRRYVEVISHLQKPFAKLLDAEVASSNGSGGSVVGSFHLHLVATIECWV